MVHFHFVNCFKNDFSVAMLTFAAWVHSLDWGVLGCVRMLQGWQCHFESFVADCVASRNVFVQLEDVASIVERVDDLPWRFIDCHLDEIFLCVQFVWGIFSGQDSQDKDAMCVSFVFDVFQCGSVHPVQAEMMSAAPFAQLHEGFVNCGCNSPCFGSLVLLVGVGGDQS